MGKKNDKGYSLVELLVVMAIMGILGTMLVTMMNIGGKLYRNANATMEAHSNARLAMSYITMRIRQNDVLDRIDAPASPNIPCVKNVTVNVKENNVIVHTTSYSALTIIHSIDPTDPSDPTNTYWIYYDDVSKKLMEQTVSTGDTSTSNLGEEIADIGDCIIEKSDALDTSDPIKPKVLYRKIIIKVKPLNGTAYLSQEITLRSQYNIP